MSDWYKTDTNIWNACATSNYKRGEKSEIREGKRGRKKSSGRGIGEGLAVYVGGWIYVAAVM